MNKIDKEIAIIAICCLTIIELGALLMGFNGQVLRWTTGLIVALAGVALPSPFTKQ